MIIGVPKEIMKGERRVAVTPEIVSKFVADGATILVESGAGAGANFLDSEYEKAGATLIDDVTELFQKAEVIMKVKEPLFNEQTNMHEIDMMHKGQYLITFIHPASPVNHEMVQKMADKGIIGLTLDGVPRISRAQKMDALTSMSTCAGYKGVIMATDHLTKFVPQIFSAVGMIKPANVFVVGAGVSGLQAIATAKRLGAVVYATDIRPDACEQAKSLGAKIVDSGVPADIAVGQGGYANSLSNEWVQKQVSNIREAMVKADIVILTALVPGKKAPILMTEDIIKEMSPGSVVVDISVDQGGNCDLTEPGEIVQKHNVTIQGIKNIPGQVPTSSTWMFANNVYHLVSYLTKDGKINLDMSDEIVSSIMVTDGEKIVHEGTKEAMGLI
ncbi:NAD(P) transhydrogenase subunit alpha [Alkalicella caledoniensis]|uniref:proton-translocating NAD(P)(+) transhydrogenase n=1 Tax=Alkalicella caledoniensis TaxID=2731377 RepID=A0A7G9WBY0_ALKCA|nr:NAD(P) transhydrogenase subunit alpha [Alkalicella caledoniensis]QNO16192.1 NAD(P) transhydrogenase subunit alpha [Alkalicella caledoniensis]